MNCILCATPANIFFTSPQDHKSYLHCESCDLRFLDPAARLSRTQEHERYLSHNNDINDPRYQDFVKPIFDLTIENKNPSSIGLDYGCGGGPVLSHLLKLSGYTIYQYDPFFNPSLDYLSRRYDYILMTEVAEHFFYPDQEFSKLTGLLNDGGALGVMTQLFDPTVNFSSWYYKNDPTHVSFYSVATFQWIAKKFKLHLARQVGNRTIWLTKNP